MPQQNSYLGRATELLVNYYATAFAIGLRRSELTKQYRFLQDALKAANADIKGLERDVENALKKGNHAGALGAIKRYGDKYAPAPETRHDGRHEVAARNLPETTASTALVEESSKINYSEWRDHFYTLGDAVNHLVYENPHKKRFFVDELNRLFDAKGGAPIYNALKARPDLVEKKVNGRVSFERTNHWAH